MSKHTETRITVYFDQRRALKDGTFPIKLRLYHQGKERPIQIGKSCSATYWIYLDHDNPEFIRALEKGQIRYVSTKHPNSTWINNFISSKKNIAEQFIENNASRITMLTTDQVKELLVAKLANPEHEDDKLGKKSSTLTQSFQAAMDGLEKSESWGYFKIFRESKSTWTKFLEAELGTDDIELIHISKGFLNRFVEYCKSDVPKGHKRKKSTKGMKPNSIAIKLRCLRQVINTAIDDEDEQISLNDYPFRGFRMPKNKTVKRAIETDVLENIRSLPLEHDSLLWHHRNYFLFMFNNQGMNLVDLAFLTRKQIVNNRLQYLRTKTRGKTAFNIELTEESLEILVMYDYLNLKPDELVFPLMKGVYGVKSSREVYEAYSNDRTNEHNRYLNKLAKMAGLDMNLTSYVARYTWAAEGFNEVENIDVIGQGLGHNDNPKITKIYAGDLKTKRLDEVNRKVTKRKSKIITKTSNERKDTE